MSASAAPMAASTDDVVGIVLLRGKTIVLTIFSFFVFVLYTVWHL